MSIDRINGLDFYSNYPDERSEINELIKDLKFSIDVILNKSWSSNDLHKLKDIAEKVVEQTNTLQDRSSVFSVEYEVLNRIKDKVHDFVIGPVHGLLNPSTTESSPKELWGAIESAFNGPWSLYQELNLLNSNTY